MIVIFHKKNRTKSVFDYENNQELKIESNKLVTTFFSLANAYSDRLIVWCHVDLKHNLNIEEFGEIFHNQLIMCSFETSDKHYMDSSIGYVEASPFINVNKSCKYPTWLMSSDIGGMYSKVINRFKNDLSFASNLDLVLNYISKKGMPNGLLCYSNPRLLNMEKVIDKKSIKKSDLITFIKSNYKHRWVYIYLFNNFIYQKKILALPFFISILGEKIRIHQLKLDTVQIPNQIFNEKSVDVLIPTLGRKKELLDVLKDLNNQTVLPKNVIIVEQNSEEGSISELDYLNGNWNFIIKHHFTHQLGACNARNIGLSLIESDFVFFADDDIRFSEKLIEESLVYMYYYNADAITLNCLQENEVELHNRVHQWPTFGTNASISKTKYLDKIRFRMAYEFGYGEDSDFGMQLRNQGCDILYVPFVKMLHLKAPIGGFRFKITKEWGNDEIQPKPAPTVMVYKLKHNTKEQLQSYKTTLFTKFYRRQLINNPLKYYKTFQKSWNQSIYWANYLIKKDSDEV